MRALISAMLMALAAPALASEPGQPLDCSDFQSVEAGLSCRTYAGMGQRAFDMQNWKGTNKVVDNLGRQVFLRKVQLAPYLAPRVEIVAVADSGESVLGFFVDREYDTIRLQRGCDVYRCDEGGLNGQIWGNEWIRALPAPIAFDAINGRLLAPLYSENQRDTSCYGSSPFLAVNRLRG